MVVRRIKEDEIAGVLEFAGRDSEDPEFMAWMAEHRADNGGKIRVSKGGTGVRVAFSRKADIATWSARSEKAKKQN